MDEVFELPNADGAQRYLRQFDFVTKREGEVFVAGGFVSDVRVVSPNRVYSGFVEDDTLRHDIRIYHTPGARKAWDAKCSCGRQACAHAFAVLRTLLAQHSEASVRNLSAGISTPATQRASSTPSVHDAVAELSRQLSTAVGRPLRHEELQFLARLTQVHARCRKIRAVSRWDFSELGMKLPGKGWDLVQVAEVIPANLHEFWFHLAYAALQAGGEIPSVMKPITDPQEVSEFMRKRTRQKEIERWSHTLATTHMEEVSFSRREIDLRVRIDLAEFRIEIRTAGAPTFERFKSSQFHRLNSDLNQARVCLSPQADCIWLVFGDLLMYGAEWRWQYLEPRTTRLLRRVFQFPILEGHIVGRSGSPLLRSAEPLRWSVTPAASADDDYRFFLMRSDGTALTDLLAVLPGHPAYYVTPDTLHLGPPKAEHVLNPSGMTAIPAPALERSSGLAFLRTLGVEIPDRLRERIRILPFQVHVGCHLQANVFHAGVEECHIKIEALAENGRRLVWTGESWLEKSAPQGSLEGQDVIFEYDTTALQNVTPLLEPLKLRRGPSGLTSVARVTRKFPEMFGAWLKTLPSGVHVFLAGELQSFANADVAGRVSLEVSEKEIDWFDLRVVLNVNDTTLSPSEVKLLLRAKGAYVRLPGKGWRRLQFDLSDAENERLARLGLTPHELSAEPQRLHALQLADPAAKTFLPEEQMAEIQRRASEIKARVTPDAPEGLNPVLRPYQLEGFHFLAYLTANRFGGVLADDMGLGKTLQTLCWLSWLHANGAGDSEAAPEKKEDSKPTSRSSGRASGSFALVVCPKSVMDNWRAEAARFTPELRVKVWTGQELSQFEKQTSSAEVHVINYAQLRLLGESLTRLRWRAVVLDEGQYIKNPSSVTAQVARSLSAEHRLILSGTPIENRLLDLWSLMAFAMPGLLGSRAHFAKLYDAKEDPLARLRLASRVRPFLLRRTKSQVAEDLPDRTEEDLFCEMEEEQKALYRAELKRAQQIMLGITSPAELAGQQFNFLVSLLRLRQICCHPRLHDPESKASSAKVEALLEHLEPLMEEGNKVLVFSQFVELLDLLRPLLEERKWPIFYLAGDTENRGELVKEFQEARGSAVFLISLKAGGFGLNLTAASYVVLFDPWWNPAVENQAIDRTHRIGQRNKVIAYRLLIKNSIEEKIRELQKKKKALAENVLGEERFAQSLSLSDLQFLLKDDLG